MLACAGARAGCVRAGLKKLIKIKGISVASILHKISQYADDTSLTVVGDESIERLAYHLDLYEKASGAKVNREKCEGLWLGSNQNRTDKPLGFKWQTDKIKVLGIHIGNMALFWHCLGRKNR